MCEIFISYHRNDSQCWAGRICDHLSGIYTKDKVFRDIRSISPGETFPERIKKAIEESKTVIVVIGSNWDDRIGEPEENNWVLKELKLAIKLEKYFIPITVEKTENPKKFGEELKAIKFCNSIPVGDDNFDQAMKLIISVIDKQLKTPPSFNMALWKPFGSRRGDEIVIDFPRIGLRDSWYVNSEEVRLLVGDLRFLYANVAQPIESMAEIDQSNRYKNNHLVVIGGPSVGLSRSGQQTIQRNTQDRMARRLKKILGDDFDVYRKAKILKNGTVSLKAAITFPEEWSNEKRKAQTKEENGKVVRDCGLIVRMKSPFNPDKKVLWAFGFTAPGTYAAIKADTQRKLSDLIVNNRNNNDNDDLNYDFIALFEVDIIFFENQSQALTQNVNIFCFHPL